MDTDRRRTSKSKRYELGYYLAIDWCKVPYILMLMLTIYLISSVTASAYHNSTNSRENEIESDYKPMIFVQKLMKFNYTKEMEANPGLDLGVISLDSKTTSEAPILVDNKNSLGISKKEIPNESNILTHEAIKNNQIVTKEYLNTAVTDVEFIITEIPEVTTELDTEKYPETTILEDEYKSSRQFIEEYSTTLNPDEEVATTEIYTENILEVDKIPSLNSNKSAPNIKRETLPGFNSTTLKNIVHQIQEQVNIKLNDSLHSNENVIEDSYKSQNITFLNNKSNKTEELRNNVTLSKNNDTKLFSGTKIDEIQNKTDASNSTKKLEDDYNTSYEMEDYDEEKIFSMKKSVTEAPSSGTFDAIRDFAGSVMESIYETVMPRGLKDLFKRMQEQNEKLETIRLRSKEENGGIGQLGRSIIKGITVPINQLMQGVRDYGSLDSDKNFFAGVASGVVSMADSVGDSFKDRVRAIFPGTLWCGDGDMARSAEVGIFFMTDSCCRRHDACKQYILSGETKYGLTNTGLFTRSHCECDKVFYRCLKRTNSLVSSQIGLTYFSILGPQCFKREHPIMRCKRRTRLTNQKCEEYDLDHSQPKIWQWFDNETF